MQLALDTDTPSNVAIPSCASATTPFVVSMPVQGAELPATASQWMLSVPMTMSQKAALYSEESVLSPHPLSETKLSTSTAID